MNESLNVPAVVVTGAISHGLLALARHRDGYDEPLPRFVVRRTLQGGAALGAGALAWNSFSKGRAATGLSLILLSAGALLLTADKSPNFVPERQDIL